MNIIGSGDRMRGDIPSHSFLSIHGIYKVIDKE
nr:MAG TPA: hypothetical protein [Caudoviricetes sp.]